MPDHSHGWTTPAEAVEQLVRFPLLEAILGRRSRRFGRGMAIPDGPLAHRSRHAPAPLSEVERLLLIAIGTGVSGWNLGIPHSEAGHPGTASNYTVRAGGRSYPSGAATNSAELLVTDDNGAWITQFRDLDPGAIRAWRGPADLPRFLDLLRPHVRRLSERRVELPAEFPHIAAHNRWVANRPGTTLFIPVRDQVDGLFNTLWIMTGEGVPVSDPATGRLLGDGEAWVAAGRLRRERAIPLPVLEARAAQSGTSELTLAAYNIQLLMQAMGLGGWLFSGINPLSLLGAFAPAGIPGFGFRFQRREGWAQPNPVGLDGLLEPLVPPYVADMAEAARRFVDRKFGPGGTHDPARPGPFRDNAGVKAGIDRYGEAFTAYLGSVAQDVWDSHGRFPATTPTIGTAVYTQAQHIDRDFYDRFYAEGAYLPSHADHDRLWHAAGGEG